MSFPFFQVHTQTTAVESCGILEPPGLESFPMLEDFLIMWVLMENELTSKYLSPEKGQIQALCSYGLDTS